MSHFCLLHFSCSVMSNSLSFCDSMHCSTPGLPVHHQLPEFVQTHVRWVSDAIQPSHPLLSPFPPSFNLSQHQGLFIWVRWPKYWSFSFSISLSNEYSGLISFRMEWLDLLAVQGTLNSLLQHHSSKASILWHSAFFIVQLSHPYVTTGKTIALTRQAFVGKLMSLAFNMLSRLFIAFLPRSIQYWFPLGLTGWISLQSKWLSPAPQFKNINSSALSFLSSLTLTSIHDYWKNHSFD